MTVAATLPGELLDQIFIAGATDPQYGQQFAAKCMLLARWIQSTVASLLYDVVIIDTESQMESFLLALENDDQEHRSYKVRKIVRNFVVKDRFGNSPEDNMRDPKFWSSAIWKVTHTLDMSNWKEIEIPVPLIDFSGDETTVRTYRLPDSTTLVRYSPIYQSHRLDYERVRRLRFRTSGIPFVMIPGLVESIATKHPDITHLAIIATAWPANIYEVLILAELGKDLQCIVVMKSVGDDGHGDTENDGTRIIGHRLMSIEPPKLVLWEDSVGDIKSIYNDHRSELLWARAESELVDPERKVEEFERLRIFHTNSAN